MKKIKLIVLQGILMVSMLVFQTSLFAQEKKDPVLDFINLRFGMFIHFNTGTYYAEQWAYPFHDPKGFKPSAINCDQWAQAAQSAGMKYGVFTTKHHDGFCLWDTKVTNYDIASSDYPKLDIVKQYSDAFRKAGLKVGLYFSVWDRHHGVQHGNINKENIAFTKEQLTELLTNYGEITCFVIDGWGSRWGSGPDFDELPFAVLADHIHSIQPNCLVINHSCRADLAYTEVVHYEATHGQHIPYDNTFPSQQGPTIQPAWFWEKQFADVELKSVKSVTDELRYSNSHYSNYLLNCAPNDKGLMDDNVIKRLKEIGENVVFNDPLAALPKIEKPNKNVIIKASSTLAEPNLSANNLLDCNLFTGWKADDNDANPTVELDFGKPETFNCLSMHGGYYESIQEYVVEAFIKKQWNPIYTGGPITPHEKRIFDNVTAQKFRLRVLKRKSTPEIVEMTFVKY